MTDYNLDGLPPSLLTTANPKTAKGEKLGYLTAIMHLAPAKLSGVANVCAHASAGCEAACLNTAGRGGMGLDEDGLNKVQAARIRRTRWFKRDQEAFMDKLWEEISRHRLLARKHGLEPAVRLNGTSDIPWENVTAYGGCSIMEMFSDAKFYDYTKFPIRLRKNALGLPNYSLAFSLAEDNDQNAKDALAAGINVVVVFAVKRGRPLPETFWGHDVIDGDEHDLRFLDPSPCIVGLRAKGRGINDTSGFVRRPE